MNVKLNSSMAVQETLVRHTRCQFVVVFVSLEKYCFPMLKRRQ